MSFLLPYSWNLYCLLRVKLYSCTNTERIMSSTRDLSRRRWRAQQFSFTLAAWRMLDFWCCPAQSTIYHSWTLKTLQAFSPTIELGNAGSILSYPWMIGMLWNVSVPYIASTRFSLDGRPATRRHLSLYRRQIQCGSLNSGREFTIEFKRQFTVQI